MPKYSNWHYHKKDTLEHYSSSRSISESALHGFATNIIELAKTSSINPSIKELGTGNGRMLLPIIEKLAKDKSGEFNLIGVDESEYMLDSFREYLEKVSLPQNIKVQILKEDIQAGKAVCQDCFDLIFTFAVFHILDNWQHALDKMYIQLKPGGYFVYVKEINQVFHSTEKAISVKESPDLLNLEQDKLIYDFFKQYHQLREKYNVSYKAKPDKEILYSDNSSLVRYLLNKGMKLSVVCSGDLNWTKPHTIKELISSFEFARITTFGSEIPNNIRHKIADDLWQWCDENNVDVEKTQHVPANLLLYIFKK